MIHITKDTFSEEHQIRINKLLQEVYSDNGWLIENGYTSKQEQKQYASHVEKAMYMQGQASFLEAGTGIGKTFGYLLPLAAKAALSQSRLIISTRTISLQSSILSTAIKMVEKCLADFDFPYFTHAQRIGMRHFIDYNKAIQEAINHKHSHPRKYKEFTEWASKCATEGDGLIKTWFKNNKNLPFNISPDDICITPTSQKEINSAYDLQMLNSKSSNIVITSHAMLICTMNNDALGEIGNRDTVLLDEADSIINVAENLSQRRLNITKINRTISKNKKSLTKKGLVICSEINESAHKLEEKYSCQTSELIFFKSNSEIKEVTNKINYFLKLVCSVDRYIKKSFKHSDEATALINIAFESEQISRTLKTQNVFMCGYRTKAYNDFGFILKKIHPGGILKYFINREIPLIFTSATLCDRASAENNVCFDRFKRGLRIFDSKQVGEECSIEPKSFGKAKYKLITNKSPKPIKKNEDEEIEQDYEINPDWLFNVAKTIKNISNSGKKVLVLTSSYNETSLLMSQLGSIATPHNGGDITSAFKEHLSDNTAVLITPAGWEGQSYRKHDKQHFEVVVITKIPFLPPDEIKIYNKAVSLANDHEIPKSALIRARNYIEIDAREHTAKKLIQGMGRLIRSADDTGEIIILDPRFPKYFDSSAKNSFLRNCIPKRFFDNYKNHKTINCDGIDESGPSIKEVVNFL